jgi:hypothetical protein
MSRKDRSCAFGGSPKTALDKQRAAARKQGANLGSGT